MIANLSVAFFFSMLLHASGGVHQVHLKGENASNSISTFNVSENGPLAGRGARRRRAMTTPIVPKDPSGSLQALVLGRISTEHQNLENIDASYADSQRRLEAMYNGPIFYKFLGERGSGWNLRRASILEAEDDIRTSRWDVVIMEDLGRAYRNPQFQYRLAHICVDHRTRLICFGDGLDTGSENWEAILGTAVLRHSMQVPETRRRVRRTATHAFHLGGMVLHTSYGYRKLTVEEASSGTYGPPGLRLAKVEAATPIIREIRERILRGDSYASIATWLNDQGIPTGPKCRTKRWTGRLVAELMRNPILQGVRRFRVVQHELVYETGEHRRVRNAAPEVETIAELAHLSPTEQVELWAVMDQYAPSSQENGRPGRSRRDSFWPGQHLRCAICGAVCYWCPNNRLKCSNARPEIATCWNQTLVDAEQIRIKVLAVLLAYLRQQPELQETMITWISRDFECRISRDARRYDDLEHQIRDLGRRRDRIAELLIQAENSEGLLQQLQSAEQNLREVRAALEAARASREEHRPCWTDGDVAEHLDEIVLHLARTSYAFGQLLRRTFEPLLLVPVQALDTAQVHPRLKLTLPPLPGNSTSTSLVIDAFESPKQVVHAQHVRQAQEQHPGKSIAWISKHLGISWEIVSRAAMYAKLMVERGTDDPYVELTAPPARASRWRKQSLADARLVEPARPEGAPFAEAESLPPRDAEAEIGTDGPLDPTEERRFDRSSSDPDSQAA